MVDYLKSLRRIFFNTIFQKTLIYTYISLDIKCSKFAKKHFRRSLKVSLVLINWSQMSTLPANPDTIKALVIWLMHPRLFVLKVHKTQVRKKSKNGEPPLVQYSDLTSYI
jgi:hypothetical protein